jgi:hypothetical protein
LKRASLVLTKLNVNDVAVLVDRNLLAKERTLVTDVMGIQKGRIGTRIFIDRIAFVIGADLLSYRRKYRR